jgi:hypothetical protein
MATRKRADTPILSCPDCLAWGPSYGSRSCCRACYDFVRSYPPAQCEGCGRVIAVKKGHCRLCWLQAGLTTAGGRRLALEDFKPPGCWQLSLSGMNRLGNTGPAPATTAAGPPASTGWTQLELRAPGESRYFDARYWVASTITNQRWDEGIQIPAPGRPQSGPIRDQRRRLHEASSLISTGAPPGT